MSEKGEKNGNGTVGALSPDTSPIQNGEPVQNDQIKLQEPNGNGTNHKKRSSQQSNGDASNSRRESRRQSKRDKANVVDVFEIEETEEESKYPLISKILDNNIFNVYITLITIYALFGDDIRVMGFTNQDDIYFDIVTITALVTFTIEITMSIISKPGYVFSFFFWLDIMSTLSLVMDIQMVANEIFFSGDAANTVNLARAGRTSRVGTKAGRVVRLVRLIRIVKLYKASTDIKAQRKNIEARLKAKRESKAKKKGITQYEISNKNKQIEKELEEQKEKEEEKKQQQQKESRVSKKLSDLTTKRVIVIVLTLLFIMPLFTADYYYDYPVNVDFQTQILRDMTNDPTINIEQIHRTYQYILDYGKNTVKTPLVRFETPFGTDQIKGIMGKYQLDNYETNDLVIEDDLRQSEISARAHEILPEKFCQKPQTYVDNEQDSQSVKNFKTELADITKKVCDILIQETPVNDEDQQPNEKLIFSASLNTRGMEIFNSALSLGRTVFVCIVLTMGALLFSKDANDLALRPIERMIDKVNQIARNPNEARNQEVQEEKGKEQYETVIIENAITKIGTLLALGFGEAGSEIIGSNMQSVGDINPLIPGKKKVCIYGFCDIRNFTDATEQLQEDVMLFVNNIGGIVHSMVDRFLGAANKNIGDAFLLVWKLAEDKVTVSDDNIIEYKDPVYVSMYSDFATCSFMKIQAKINREPCILEYRKDQRLLDRFKDYKVRIGYGLHIGWSIEGAIGSEFKIDASYLSPNVKMSERLEGTTKVYGVPLLISQDLFERFSPKMKLMVRKLDCVMFSGTSVQKYLYTIDMEVEGIPVSKGFPSDKEKKEEKQIEDRLKRDEILKFLSIEDAANKWDCQQFIKSNKDLKLITENFNQEFLDTYHNAVDLYIQGKWNEAKEMFDKGLLIKPNDGPSKVIKEFMQITQFKAPADWQGYRPMQE